MRDVYSDKAAHWWDANGPFTMLHRMHPLRMACIADCIGDFQGLHVLDYGCGGGLLALSLAQAGANVLGVDTSAASIAAAQAQAKACGLSVAFQHGTVDDLADKYFTEDPFDLVCALECLEHVQYPRRLIQSLASALKPGGYAVFSTLNRHWYAYVMGIIAAEYLLGWVEPGTHEYAKFIKPSELVRWSREAGLSLHLLTGLSFDTAKQDFYLSQDVSLNYLAVFHKS